MKKIIELIEKALDTMQLPGFEHTQETYDAFTKVANALAARRQLEQTPITEEWLKEHGWVEDIEWGAGMSYRYPDTRYGVMIKPDGEAVLIDYDELYVPLDSVARLYDACELFKIEID